VALRNDISNAKDKLMNELDTFKVPEVDAIREEPEENEEKEDTTILKFLVMNPLKVGGHVKYTI